MCAYPYMSGDRCALTAWRWCGLVFVTASISIAVSPDLAPAAELQEIVIRELATDYTWGYHCGVKQPLGAHKNGLSVHQLTKNNVPIEWNVGNPDYLFWVDEYRDLYGIAKKPTGMFDGWVKNPGGMVAFGSDGHLWFTYGARANNLPPDLFLSPEAYDPDSFNRVLDDYVTSAGSTSWNLLVGEPKLMMAWREGWSPDPTTTVRFRRYDTTVGMQTVEHEVDVGLGHLHETMGDIGIEQVWTRFDPRFNYTLLTWHWLYVDPHMFGSCPFVYSEDYGDTWRKADGTVLELPVHYGEIDDVLVPHDHLPIGDTTSWQQGDLGVSPNGTFWMMHPWGDARIDGMARPYFWFFNGSAWEHRDVVGGMYNNSKPYACGATANTLIMVYSAYETSNILHARVSYDDGVTWSEPIVLDAMDPTDHVSWVSFAQPADGYINESARFYYAYFNDADGAGAKTWRNRVNWVRVTATPPEDTCPCDLTDDDVVDVIDLMILIGDWGACP